MWATLTRAGTGPGAASRGRAESRSVPRLANACRAAACSGGWRFRRAMVERTAETSCRTARTGRQVRSVVRFCSALAAQSLERPSRSAASCSSGPSGEVPFVPVAGDDFPHSTSAATNPSLRTSNAWLGGNLVSWNRTSEIWGRRGSAGRVLPLPSPLPRTPRSCLPPALRAAWISWSTTESSSEAR